MEIEKIIYIGRDEKYFYQYVSSLEKNLKKELEKKIISEVDNNANQYLSAIIDFSPDLIVLDYSEDKGSLMKLSFFLSRINPIKNIPLIGFLSNDGDHSEDTYKLMFSGVNFLFFKLFEIEFSSVATLMLLGEKRVHFPDFVLKKRNLDIMAKYPARVGYMTSQYLHIETNLKLNQTDYYLFETPMIRNGLDPEKVAAKEAEKAAEDDDDESVGWNDEAVDERLDILYKMNREMDENLYYNYDYAYDITPQHYKGLIEEDKEDVLKARFPKDQLFYTYDHYEKLQEFLGDYEDAPDSYHDYFMEEFNVNETPQNAKRSRLMIIDEKLEILNQSKEDIDKFNVNIRVHQSMPEKDEPGIIKESKPGVIVYIARDTEEKAIKELDLLKEEVEKISNYYPFIIIWDARENPGGLVIGYDKVLNQKRPFDFQTLLKIMDMYDKQGGREKTHDSTTSYGSGELRYYFRKKDPNSRGFINFPIRINILCEAFAIFETSWDIPMHSNFYIELGEVSIILTVIETPGSYEGICNKGQFFAVVTALSEGMQTNFRKFIFSLE